MAFSTYQATNYFAGEGTWNREARRVARLAAAQGLCLDAESLLLRDVRELQAMRQRLQRGLDRHGLRRWFAGRRTLPAAGASHDRSGWSLV